MKQTSSRNERHEDDATSQQPLPPTMPVERALPIENHNISNKPIEQPEEKNMRMIKHLATEQWMAVRELLSSCRGRRAATTAIVTAAFLGVGATSCVTTSDRASQTVVPPDQALQSPNMDFTHIKAVGIFPFFPTGTEDEAFGDSLSTAFVAEVQTRQGSAWKIYSQRDIFQSISEANLGQGYKQLQADHNSSGIGRLVLTPGTREFLRALQAKCGADAFLIGSYRLGSQSVSHKNPYTGQVEIRQVPTYSVQVALYSVQGDQYWWNARIARSGDKDSVIKTIAASLAANVGTGTLRNL
jgi:hypothetical protein